MKGKQNKKVLRIFISVFAWVGSLHGQNVNDSVDTSPFTSLTKEIINLKPDYSTEDNVSITNLSEINVNEAPGIVYLITSADIEKNGYRDLLDIFMDIPGFNIANDVQNSTALTLRGFWTQEAKILYMIDGMPMNDMSFGSFTFFGHLSLINIDRIEVIKGSGSSIYGGMAGLGVVNIITKSGKRSNGSSYLMGSGVSNNGLSRSAASFHYGIYLLNGIDLTASGGVFNGNRSNFNAKLPDNTLVNFKDSSQTNNVYLNLKLSYKDFVYKIFYDDYTFQDSYNPVTSLSKTFLNEIRYNVNIGKIKFTPFFLFKNQIPWNVLYGDPLVYETDNLVTYRINSGTKATVDVNKSISVLSGIEFYKDYARQYRRKLLSADQTSLSINSYAAFIETQIKTKVALFFLGARLDKYGFYKYNYSPRFSITKNFSHWNYKIILGKSFKIPTIENINLSVNNSIQPELYRDLQIELGYRKKNSEIKINGFYTESDQLIIFNYDNQTLDLSYVNKGFSDVAGAEIFYKTSIKNYYFKTTYSHYQIVKSNVDDILVDTANLKLGNLAVPLHKFTANVRVEINEKNAVSINYILQSEKFAQTRINFEEDAYGLVKYPITNNYDFTYQRKSILKLFDLNVGVLNLLNTKNYYSYPYKSGYFPVIGMGRELFVQLKIRLQN